MRAVIVIAGLWIAGIAYALLMLKAGGFNKGGTDDEG